ncbi:MAG: PilZ domain-containing protein [Thioalkalispiraceae bacterium]|jgi:hypothetical protein
MEDKRKDSRLGIKLEVELKSQEQELSLETRDLSNSGVFLTAEEASLPTEGSIVELRIKQPLGESEPPLVKARVVRIDNDGIALSFITDE